MKKSIFNFAIAIILVFPVQLAMANNGTSGEDSTIMFTATQSEVKVNAGAFGEVIGAEKGTRVAVDYNSPEYIRRPKALANDFTGYKIELMTVFNQPLALNDELFQQFGGIAIEQRTDNSFTYLLGGNFENKKAADQFLTQIVQAKYPNAKTVKYKNGQQVKCK